MAILDTSPDAAAVHAAVLRRMSPEQRVRAAFEMSDSLRELTLAGLRTRHPDWSEVRLRDELLWIMYGFRRP